MYPFPAGSSDDRPVNQDVRTALPEQRPPVDAAMLDEPTTEVPVIRPVSGSPPATADDPVDDPAVDDRADRRGPEPDREPGDAGDTGLTDDEEIPGTDVPDDPGDTGPDGPASEVAEESPDREERPEDTGPAAPAGRSEPTESTGGAESTGSAESAGTAGSPDSADSADSADSPGSADPVDPADSPTSAAPAHPVDAPGVDDPSDSDSAGSPERPGTDGRWDGPVPEQPVRFGPPGATDRGEQIIDEPTATAGWAVHDEPETEQAVYPTTDLRHGSAETPAPAPPTDPAGAVPAAAGPDAGPDGTPDAGPDGTTPTDQRIAVWSEEAADRFRQRWREWQGRFIDDPAEAVAGAQALVADAVRELADTLLEAQRELDPYRDQERIDTEAMRVAMRRYREFLERVLAL